MNKSMGTVLLLTTVLMCTPALGAETAVMDVPASALKVWGAPGVVYAAQEWAGDGLLGVSGARVYVGAPGTIDALFFAPAGEDGKPDLSRAQALASSLSCPSQSWLEVHAEASAVAPQRYFLVVAMTIGALEASTAASVGFETTGGGGGALFGTAAGDWVEAPSLRLALEPSLSPVAFSKSLGGASVGGEEPSPTTGDDAALPTKVTILAMRRPGTGVAFEVGMPGSGALTLEVFDLRGRRVWRQDVRATSAGTHVLQWDGRSRGRRVSNGTYFARARSGSHSATTKVLLYR